jgi:hypothetical protein
MIGALALDTFDLRLSRLGSIAATTLVVNSS